MTGEMATTNPGGFLSESEGLTVCTCNPGECRERGGYVALGVRCIATIPVPIAKNEPKHSHYHKPCPYDRIDVYRVLDIFEVTDPVLQHIIKKALCAGDRGHKDFRRDVQDIADSAKRRLEMLDEEGK